ncbi:hypothetical protein HY993_01465 [Candidatus Micrarchaeota archaeon]|nr:hypothetical protein [Candidatus Micrarchaeota archaeon]
MILRQRMNKGFFSPIIIALATITALALLSTVFSASNSNNALLTAVESQKVADKAADYSNALDYALMESLLDSAYSIRGCAPTPGDYCALSQTKFGDYSAALSQQLSADSVNASTGVISYPPCSDFKASENLGFSESISFAYSANPQVYSTLASKAIPKNPSVIASAFNNPNSFGFVFRDSSQQNFLQTGQGATISNPALSPLLDPSTATEVILPASPDPYSFVVDMTGTSALREINAVVSFHNAQAGSNQRVTNLVVEASQDNSVFQIVVPSTSNPPGVSVFTFPPVTARYLKFTYSKVVGSPTGAGVTKIGAFTSLKAYFASCT